MLSVTTSADFSDVLAGLGAVKAGASPHRTVKQFLVEDQRDHAAKREGPEGAWAPRALATVQKMRIERVRRRPLGKLLGAGVAYRANRGAVVGTSKVKWSSAQQDGGRVGRGVTLKARPFLWLSRSLLDQSTTFIAGTYAKRFGGR